MNENDKWEKINSDKRREIMLGQSTNLVAAHYLQQDTEPWKGKNADKFEEDVAMMFNLMEVIHHKILEHEEVKIGYHGVKMEEDEEDQDIHIDDNMAKGMDADELVNDEFSV